MKKILFAFAAIAAAFVLSLSSSNAASAATEQAPTAPAGVSAAPADVGVQQTCRVRVTATVTVRSLPSTNGTALGLIPAGTWVLADCVRITGGTYTACGLTSNYWLRVYWNGITGYIPWACTTT